MTEASTPATVRGALPRLATGLIAYGVLGLILALIAAAAWYFMNNSRAVPATTPADSTRTSLVAPDAFAEGPSNG